MKGDVKLTSNWGKGSNFVITLPVQVGKEQEFVENFSLNEDQGGEFRILFYEQNEFLK